MFYFRAYRNIQNVSVCLKMNNEVENFLCNNLRRIYGLIDLPVPIFSHLHMCERHATIVHLILRYVYYVHMGGLF